MSAFAITVIYRGAVLGIASCLLVACLAMPSRPVLRHPDGTRVEAPVPPDAAAEQRALELSKHIAELSVDGSSKDEVVRARQELLTEHPSTNAAADTFYSQALAAQAAGENGEAVSLLERLLFYHPDFHDGVAARLLYARLLLGVGRFADGEVVLRELFVDAQDTASKSTILKLLVSAHESLGAHGRALELVMTLRALSGSTPTDRAWAENRARELSAFGIGLTELQALWDRYGDDQSWAFLHDVLCFRLARVLYHVREYERAGEFLDIMASRFPASPWASAAVDLRRLLDGRFKVSPRLIGVLLPLSGRFAHYGERALAAVRLGLSAYPSIKMVVRDTAGDATQASRMAAELVVEHHVIAIVGPLVSRAAMAVAHKAEEYDVPMLGLSHRRGLPQVGPNVFRTALTVAAQARELSRLAFEQLGYSRFAILYPRNSYGRSFAGEFWDDVERRGGSIAGVQVYEHDQTTFREPIQKLVGRWYRDSREDYRQRKEEILEMDIPGHRKRAVMERLHKNLPPIVDFDAIVIPDSGRSIGLLAPALAFEDIVTTRDPKELEKIKKATGYAEIKPVTLLGGSTWNSPRTLRGCEGYCEGAVFVDGYWSDNPSTKTRDFVAAFAKATDGARPNLSDAQAYDSARLLGWLLAGSKPTTRAGVRELLFGTKGFGGVTGTMSFSSDGELRRTLFPLTITDGVITRHPGDKADVAAKPSKS